MRRPPPHRHDGPVRQALARSSLRRRPAWCRTQPLRQRTNGNRGGRQNRCRKRQRRQCRQGFAGHQGAVAKQAAVAAFVERGRGIGWRGRVLQAESVRGAPGTGVHRAHAVGHAARDHGHDSRQPHGDERQASDESGTRCPAESSHTAFCRAGRAAASLATTLCPLNHGHCDLQPHRPIPACDGRGCRAHADPPCRLAPVFTPVEAGIPASRTSPTEPPCTCRYAPPARLRFATPMTCGAALQAE